MAAVLNLLAFLWRLGKMPPSQRVGINSGRRYKSIGQ
jgi:hypothetical protein